MKLHYFFFLSFFALINCDTKNNISEQTIVPDTTSDYKGAYFTDEYPNALKEVLGKTDEEINTRINLAWNQLFHGNPANQTVYYEVGPDMAYIKDIIHNDVRSEGMSYGMMIAVQLNKKEEFDRLWKWAKTYMQHQEEPRKGYFAWQANEDGSIIDHNSASDGEEWIVTALFFASARWGDGTGIYDYNTEAQYILDAMLSKEDSSESDKVITNMFDKKEKMVVFVPVGNADNFTDPSYHVPHFYELWALWADSNNDFWNEVVSVSREYLKNAVHQKTGLAADYSLFDGTPHAAPWGGTNDRFQYDAWRVGMNIAMDYTWFAKDDWAVTQSNRMLNFFYSEGVKTYGHIYTVDGTKENDGHNPGLVAMNAVATLASTNDNRVEFLQDFWNTPIPQAQGRYYDGLLYMMALLQTSGNFKIYEPDLNQEDE